MAQRRNTDKPPLFQFQYIKADLDAWVDVKGLPGLSESWQLAQEIIEAQARFYRRFWGEDVARAKAWEDFDIALRGRGAPGISGAVFELWSNVPPQCEATLKAVLSCAVDKARSATDHRYLRYGLVDRHSPVRTLSEGLCLPEAIPTDYAVPTATSVKDFASAAGVPFGIPDPDPEEKNGTKQAQHRFTVFPGGRDVH